MPASASTDVPAGAEDPTGVAAVILAAPEAVKESKEKNWPVERFADAGSPTVGFTIGAASAGIGVGLAIEVSIEVSVVAVMAVLFVTFASEDSLHPRSSSRSCSNLSVSDGRWGPKAICHGAVRQSVTRARQTHVAST